VQPLHDRLFRMALRSQDLPDELGLDWSWGSLVATAEDIRASNSTWTLAEVQFEIIHRRGSVVSYEPVLPATLHVLTTGKSVNIPGTWPLLTETDAMDVLTAS